MYQIQFHQWNPGRIAIKDSLNHSQSEPARNVSNPRIHQLLLGDVPQDDLDHIFCFRDALGPHPEEEAKMVLEWQDGLQHLHMHVCF